MDDSLLWLVGAVALVAVVAAFVWVLRHRDDAALPEHHVYEAPEVSLSGRPGQSGITFGDDTHGDAPIDQTVPLSRLGGAGWRDGGGLPVETTTGPYAGDAPSRVPDESAVADDLALDHHVAVDDTVSRPVVDEELDRRRGGHW